MIRQIRILLFFYSWLFLFLGSANAIESDQELSELYTSAEQKTSVLSLLDSLKKDSSYSMVEESSLSIIRAFWELEKKKNNKAVVLIRFKLYGKLFKRGELKEAIILGNELLTDVDSLSSYNQYALYYTLSSAYFNIGYYQKHLELLPKKHKAARMSGRKFKIDVQEYSDLAMVYHRMKQYDKARDYNFKIIKLNEGVDSFAASHSSLYNNIAISFKRENSLDSARYYFEKALVLAKKGYFFKYNDAFSAIYKQHFINVIESDIAYLDQRPENHPKIIRCLEKEAASAKQVEEANIYLSAWNKLGKLYYDRKEYEKALHYLHLGDDELNKQNPNGDLYLNNLQLKAKIALVQGKQELGDQLLRKSEVLRDSMEAQRSKGISEIAAVIYEIKYKEREIEKQQKDLLEKNNTIKEQKRTQTIYIVFILGLGTLSFLLYLFMKKFNKQKKIIEQQKILTGKSLKQKEMLLKEVHHRVKNNLQVISGILHKQAKISSDTSVKSMMEEGQNRIKSMALVHQKLYQTEDFRNIDMESYIEDLTKSIAASNHGKDVKIELELKLSKTNFHIDVAIPLGLILNELLTNAYKYAFVGRSTGKVSVSIEKKEQHQFEMRIVDDGIGLPENMKEKIKESLGISLVEGLAWQLRGGLQYESNQGSTFIILFTNRLNEI